MKKVSRLALFNATEAGQVVFDSLYIDKKTIKINKYKYRQIKNYHIENVILSKRLGELEHSQNVHDVVVSVKCCGCDKLWAVLWCRL